MEMIIKACGYEIPAKSTAASLISYKSNFGRDGLRDLLTLAKSLSKAPAGANDGIDAITDEFLERFDLDLFFRFLWVFAKAKTPEIPPLEQWLGSIEAPPIDFALEALPQVVGLLGSTIKSTVKAKN